MIDINNIIFKRDDLTPDERILYAYIIKDLEVAIFNNTKDEDGYYWGDMIYIFDDQDENSSYYVNVLEDDVITVYGTFEGMEDTKNYLNGETSKDIALHMKYAKLISE